MDQGYFIDILISRSNILGIGEVGVALELRDELAKNASVIINYLEFMSWSITAFILKIFM